jgi:hypothetical protein
MIDKANLVRFVREECSGNTKVAAERMGVSVSYILAIAPELRTSAQIEFDIKADRTGSAPRANRP